MPTVARQQVRELMAQILERQNKRPPLLDESSLREIGFQSIDFSELALRVERLGGHPLNFDATRLRAIRTVADVLDFLENASGDVASSEK